MQKELYTMSVTGMTLREVGKVDTYHSKYCGINLYFRGKNGAYRRPRIPDCVCGLSTNIDGAYRSD
jgi:hypothetical protein